MSNAATHMLLHWGQWKLKSTIAAREPKGTPGGLRRTASHILVTVGDYFAQCTGGRDVYLNLNGTIGASDLTADSDTLF